MYLREDTAAGGQYWWSWLPSSGGGGRVAASRLAWAAQLAGSRLRTARAAATAVPLSSLRHAARDSGNSLQCYVCAACCDNGSGFAVVRSASHTAALPACGCREAAAAAEDCIQSMQGPEPGDCRPLGAHGRGTLRALPPRGGCGWEDSTATMAPLLSGRPAPCTCSSIQRQR